MRSLRLRLWLGMRLRRLGLLALLLRLVLVRRLWLRLLSSVARRWLLCLGLLWRRLRLRLGMRPDELLWYGLWSL
jgi:hypothetical protein